jgi:hypothetical protein
MTDTDHAPPYRIRIAFEACSGICLWADNAATKERFGYSITTHDLHIDPSLRARIEALIARVEAADVGTPPEPESGMGETLFGYEPEAAQFAGEVDVMAAYLRDALGPDFEIVHDFDPAVPFSIGWNRRWTVGAALVSVPLVAMCGWLCQAMLFHGFGDYSDSHRTILGVMFGAFGLLFVGVALTYARASFDEGAVLSLDKAGVHDRRLTKSPIPWAAVDSVMPIQKGAQMMLALNVEKPSVFGLPANPLWAINRLSARMTGQPELSIKATGLAADINAILHAVQTHAVAPKR